MKKIILPILIVSMSVFAACGEKDSNNISESTSTTEIITTEAATSETTTQEIITSETTTEEVTENTTSTSFSGFSSEVWLSDNGYYYFFYDEHGGRTSDIETGIGTAFGYEIISDTEVMFAMGAAENKSYISMEVIDEYNVILDWGYYKEALEYVCPVDEWSETE